MTEIVSPFQEFKVTKSWINDGVLYREGWVSTNHKDRENEITEPEAFSPVLSNYFAMGAPVSSTHDLRSYPVGHLQKGALVRDGKIFQEEAHPTDPGEFTAFPESGTGFYARHAITDPIAASHVAKGNVGGCSFIASVKKFEPIPEGGRRFLEFSSLAETTIAAYPINTQARLHIAKAYGLVEEETPEMTPEQIQAMIQKAFADAKEAEVQKATPAPTPALTPEQLTAVLTEHSSSILSQIDSKIEDVKKAFSYDREGVGRVGSVTTPADERDADPAAYIVKKAQAGDTLDATDKALIASLTLTAIMDGMRD